MRKCLGQWAPPMFWNFIPEQVQNPEKLAEYLEKVCRQPANSREIEITAMCWGLAHAYRSLCNTIQNPQGEEKVSGSDDKTTDNTATPAPAATSTVVAPDPAATGTAAILALPETGTAVTLAPAMTSTAATPAPPVTATVGYSRPPATDNAVQSVNKLLSVSLAPIHKKKYWKRKSARSEREDEKAGPSQREEEEELVDEMETT
ncbi:hypothetical protein QYF61_005565 [Mycteria americana]|uniref:Uncharacterized protein n=1 Tax=Mycteria americana TaxID=33587 RepID=A0AAN7MIV9_MYCAM|nr:hypothetical protein QYF61_005565 [Mycteria americana]